MRSTNEIVRAAKENIWRPIPGYDGVYEASFDGRIRKVKGPMQGVRRLSKKLGLLVVHLREPGSKVRKEQRVHVLVARAWLGEKPEPKDEYGVMHRNGIVTDNSVPNLVYMTRSEIGKRTGGKASRRAVLKLGEHGEILKVYPSARAAAADNFISLQAVLDRCKGKVKKCNGLYFTWEESREE